MNLCLSKTKNKARISKILGLKLTCCPLSWVDSTWLRLRSNSTLCRKSVSCKGKKMLWSVHKLSWEGLKLTWTSSSQNRSNSSEKNEIWMLKIGKLRRIFTPNPRDRMNLKSYSKVWRYRLINWSSERKTYSKTTTNCLTTSKFLLKETTYWGTS